MCDLLGIFGQLAAKYELILSHIGIAILIQFGLTHLFSNESIFADHERHLAMHHDHPKVRKVNGLTSTLQ